MQSPILQGFTACIQLQDRAGSKACFRLGVATRRPPKSGLSALQVAARVSSGLMLIAESHSDLAGSGLLLLSAVLLVHMSATSLFRHCTRDTITAHRDWSSDRTLSHVSKIELPVVTNLSHETSMRAWLPYCSVNSFLTFSAASASGPHSTATLGTTASP
jgi:hypothetical protein